MVPTQGGRRPVIVYDLGGVLIDWNPRHLYRKLFDDEATIEEAAARHPDHRPLIEAYFVRWGEMVAGEIDGSVTVFEELKKAGYELHALTNWSTETFPVARERFPVLTWF